MKTITYTDFTHRATVVAISSNDDVYIFDDTLESLEELLGFQLQFQKGTVHLVHEKNGLDTFRNGLTEYSFSLHTYTFKKIIL